MSYHDDRDPGDEFWSNEEEDGDFSDFESINEEDEGMMVDLYEFVGSHFCQDEDEINSTDSVFRSVGYFLFSCEDAAQQVLMSCLPVCLSAS